MKGIIIYKGKYGATRQYAEWAGQALQMPVNTTDETGAEQIGACDWLMIGTSIYIGEFQVKKWLLKHQQLLSGKRIILFVVCGTSISKTEELDKYLRQNVPAELLARCRCFFLPGRMNFSALSWKDKFMLKMGAMLAGKEGAAMMTEYDDVKEQHLDPVLAAAEEIAFHLTRKN
ncbi:flavodoxin domain-containing protein [Chitinophaga sp. XS-30]|uniref:flavodoxin domain-containing protein n=1 Tax=Chitinophaga sp. XS-30 TaxID=2604421 RepID=UPI0011DE273B|nr:flavodoxin domain-containing protein [Chitinophaga sp. XS-30]QEH43004.1 hypothetical protein FW415_19875 [Chitinophaga sp. XS-30]